MLADFLPKAGSTWRTRDGRLLRVEEIVNSASSSSGPLVVVSVLNPIGKMKSRTVLGIRNFLDKSPSAFLKRCEAQVDQPVEGAHQ